MNRQMEENNFFKRLNNEELMQWRPPQFSFQGNGGYLNIPIRRSADLPFTHAVNANEWSVLSMKECNTNSNTMLPVSLKTQEKKPNANSYGTRLSRESTIHNSDFQSIMRVSEDIKISHSEVLPLNASMPYSTPGICTLCRQNGEPRDYYLGHTLKDCKGEVICPVLSSHVCEYCGATGKKAHTKSHCPLLKNSSRAIKNAVALKRTRHDSSGRIRNTYLTKYMK